MAVENNRETLKSLIADLGITQRQTAELLSKQTQRPVSARTIRAWLADSELPSSRPCPEWAINLLKKQADNA